MNRRLLALPLLLLTASFGCQVNLAGVSGVRLDQSAERTDTRALEIGAGETLTIDTRYGDVDVTAASDARPEVRATIRANGRTLAEAEAVLARYELRIARGANGPVVELAGEPLRIQDGGTTLELSAHADISASVPEGVALEATSGSGDVRTAGPLGACRVETSYGTVSIGEARGGVAAKSGSGDVSAGRVEGGEVTLKSSYGDVSLAHARATKVVCRSGSGDLRVEAITADSLDLETSYGDVHAREASGALRARSGSGDVRLHDVRGTVDAESSYGTVEIDGVLEGLEAASGSGSVTARARAGSRPVRAWKLASSYGAVVLKVPEGFTCVLDAQTSYGDVECDFPITIEAGKKKRDNELRGTIGSGGETVTLSSSSGNVALKRL